MATKSTIRVINIKSFTQGSDQYKGIKQLGIRINMGTLRPKKDEGQFYATGVDRLGISDFPVQFDVQSESLEYLLALCSAAVGDAVVVGQVDGGGNDKTLTFKNASYDTSGGTIQRDQDGMFTITGKCYSADGSALPFTIA